MPRCISWHWSLFLALLGSLTGCLGGPTLRPAATDLQQVKRVTTSLTGAQPLLYVASIRAENLDTLWGITIGNRQATPLLALEFGQLRTGEIAPVGIDPAGFLLTAGIQGEPRGTLQTLDLKSGRTRKAIGEVISDEPWRITHFAPPVLLLGQMELAGRPAFSLRFQEPPAPVITLPPDQVLHRVFGLLPTESVLYATTSGIGSDLRLLHLKSGESRILASFPTGDLESALLTGPIAGALAGYALTFDRGTSSEVRLFRWREGAAPEALYVFSGKGNLGLVPPGWPPVTTEAHCVVAIPARPEASIDPEGAIYLHDAGGFRKVHNVDAQIAWLMEPNHLFWITQQRLWYRPLDAPEAEASLLLELPAQRSWGVYPAAWPGVAVTVTR